EFYGELVHAQGHMMVGVPPGSWAETRYSPYLTFSGVDDRNSYVERAEAGGPQSTVVAMADFLTPPTRGSGDYDFEFGGTPDYRSLMLFYESDKSESTGQWDIYGPPDQEPFTFPVMPPDLRSLTPTGIYTQYIVGYIYELSEVDGYAEWLNAD